MEICYLKQFHHASTPVAEAIDNSAGEDEEEDNNNSGSGNKKANRVMNKEENKDEAEPLLQCHLANSISNAIDGGSAEANKNAGSLIASGDIVVIDNQR